MSVLYADTSAIVRAYFADEPDHAALRAMLLEGDEPVVTSEIARVEFASAVTAAAQAKRLRRPSLFIDRFDADTADGGPIALVRFEGEHVLPSAHRLVVHDRLRTLDAIHLAVALEILPDVGGPDVALVTRDERQAAVGRRHGLAIR